MSLADLASEVVRFMWRWRPTFPYFSFDIRQGTWAAVRPDSVSSSGLYRTHCLCSKLIGLYQYDRRDIRNALQCYINRYAKLYHKGDENDFARSFLIPKGKRPLSSFLLSDAISGRHDMLSGNCSILKRLCERSRISSVDYNNDERSCVGRFYRKIQIYIVVCRIFWSYRTLRSGRVLLRRFAGSVGSQIP